MDACCSHPLVIAHRGFSGRHPENTLPAIRAAIRTGADYVEVDVHETRDGQIVVFHDYGLDRICGVPGRLRHKTLAELKRLNPLIPTLRQVLRVCRGKVRVLIEIKNADPRKVSALVRECGMANNVIIFSLSLRRMKALAGADPRLRRFGLVSRRIPQTLPISVEGIGASRRLITSRVVVEQVHRRGWKLFVWTVNRRSEMERLLKWGVDGLITNYPDRAKSCLARR